MAALEACPWTPDDCAFVQGFIDAGGPLVYLRHLIEDVRPCEGEWWTVYANGYLSAFQFTPGTWGSAAAHTGYTDPLNPYAVGANVAWLVQRVADPGSTAGWPTCWWRGLVP